MITQVVFDFGQVLVRYDPHAMCRQYLSDPEDIRIMETVLFDRLYWDKLDAGTISDEETIAAAKTRLPAHLQDKAQEIYDNWIYMLPEIEGMRAVLCDLTANGVKLALLSNISQYFADHAEEIPILSFFTHRVFSAVCGMTKPHRDIFEYTCRLCGSDPHQTLFIDDSAINIRGAADAGLQTYHFDGDAAALRAFLLKEHLL